MPTQSVDTSARHAHVAQQQLHHCATANDLRSDSVLRPTQGIEDGHGLVWRRGGRHQIPKFKHLLLGHAADIFHLINRVAAVMLTHQLKHAARVLEGWISTDKTVLAGLEVPGLTIVGAVRRVVAGEQSLLEAEPFSHDQARVGVFAYIFMRKAVGFDQVVDETTKERDVRPRANPGVIVRHRRGAVEARVD